MAPQQPARLVRLRGPGRRLGEERERTTGICWQQPILNKLYNSPLDFATQP
jgi:hypothetical protein